MAAMHLVGIAGVPPVRSGCVTLPGLGAVEDEHRAQQLRLLGFAAFTLAVVGLVVLERRREAR